LYNPRVAEGATRAAAKAISAKLSLLLFLGNFLGALLTFFYFRFVDFQGPEELSRVTSVEIAYSLVAFAALRLVAVWRSRRWIRPLIAAARQGSPSAVDILVSAETARRLEGASGLEPLPAVMVKGKATAVEVYRVT
jgi:hypothetical protein